MSRLNPTPSISSSQFDIIIIGGGPAGSTAASLLAEKDWSVCVLEKDKHPRFHIGESLLPMNLPIFERLGVMDEIEKIGIVKHAAEFNSPDTDRPIDTFYFNESLSQNPPSAFQVLRADLDQILLTNSRRKGATVLEEMIVTRVATDDEPRRVFATDKQGNNFEYQCRFIIDASGRDTLIASQHNLKIKNKKHQTAAIYCHFDTVALRSGKDAGNISIYWIEQGWIWMIPLRHGKMSIGLVCNPEYLKTRNSSLTRFLWDALQQVPDIAKRMKNASPSGEANATANYSYRSKQIAGNGYLLIGDAYTFIDPVFSSGVFLAMQSGLLGSELVDSILRNPETKTQALKVFRKKIHASLSSFSWFIYRFNSYAMRQLLMHHPGTNASQHFKTVKSAVISVFSGVNKEQSSLKIPLIIFQVNFYLLHILNVKHQIAGKLKKLLF